MSDIWYMLQDQNQYVYHYTQQSTLVDYILPTGKLRFSRFKDVNDPRESKDLVFSYHGVTSDLGIDVQTFQTELNRLIKHYWRIGCFVSDPYEALITRQREDLGEDIYQAAYERGHSRPRMWAQYANNFKGACLVFNKARLDACINVTANNENLNVYSGLVVYKNPPILSKIGVSHALAFSIDELNRVGIVSAVGAHVDRYWKNLFFVKARDWEQEREFRWVVSGNDDEDFFIDIEDSLVGIALGDRFPDISKPAIGAYAETNGVRVATMDWQNGVPQLKPEHWRLLKAGH